MTRVFIYIGLIISYIGLSGQSYVDLINMTWDEGFTNDYDNGTSKARFYEWSSDVTIPIVLPHNRAIITGFQYEQVNVDYDSNIIDLKTHGLALKIGLSTPHGKNWSGTYILLPKISADAINFEDQNLQMGAIVLIKRNYTPQQNLRFGFYTNTELFGPFIVPLVGYYQNTEKSEITLLAPLAAEYLYKLTPNTAIGASFRGIIKSYQLNDQTGYLSKANNELGIVAKLNFGKLVWQTIGGLTIGRNLRIYHDDDQLGMAISALKLGDNRTQLNQELSDGLFIKTSLILRFPTGD